MKNKLAWRFLFWISIIIIIGIHIALWFNGTIPDNQVGVHSFITILMAIFSALAYYKGEKK